MLVEIELLYELHMPYYLIRPVEDDAAYKCLGDSILARLTELALKDNPGWMSFKCFKPSFVFWFAIVPWSQDSTLLRRSSSFFLHRGSSILVSR